MPDEKKLALLIDSDNVSAKYAPFILQEAAKYGELSCRRVYGDWEKGDNGWHFPAINNAILPVQQTSYIAGKNATDFSIIIDAMDLLYSGNIDGFVLVTSDSDFTRLAIRLREAGKLVVGIGEVKTPLAFTSSCHHFSFLNQVCDMVQEYSEKDLREAVIDYVKNGDDRGTPLTKLDNFITSRFGNIDYNRLGYTRLSGFIDSIPELSRRATFVTKKSAPKPTSKPTAPQTTAVTLEKLSEAIKEYLSTHTSEQDNMLSLEKHLNQLFGKLDYSKFGNQGSQMSKRFSKFLDKIPDIIRDGTNVTLVESSAKSAPKTEVKAALPAPKTEIKAALPVAPTAESKTDGLTMEDFKAAVIEIVAASDGGITPARLNGAVQKKLGKAYLKTLGIEDYTAALKAITEVTFSKYKLVLAENITTSENDAPIAETDLVNKAKKADNSKNPTDSAEASAETAEIAEAADTANTAEKPTEAAITPEKPEPHSVKRFILNNISTSSEGISLPEIGKLLSQKFGKGYLKEMGFSTLKQFAARMTGVEIKDNKLKISEEFIQRTEELEQFVYDFARREGSRSIKALSTQIKKNFTGFDFTDYGYVKFSDFINAVDGVKANGYYIEPVG